MSELTLSSELLQISPEVQEALNGKKPIVCPSNQPLFLMVCHFRRMPQTAIEVEETIRKTRGSFLRPLPLLAG